MSKATFTVKHGRKNVLALNTGLNLQAFAQSRLGSLLNDTGFLAQKNGTWKEWKSEGTVEVDGKVAFFGPSFTGISFLSLIEKKEDTDKAPDPKKLWAAFRLWLNVYTEVHKKAPDLPLSTSPLGSIVDLKKESVLFLPPNIFRRALLTLGLEDSALNRWEAGKNHAFPKTFSVALLAYHLLTRRFPWDAEKGDTLRGEMQRLSPLPVRLAQPTLHPALAYLLDAGLSNKGMDLEAFSEALLSPDFAEWKDLFIPIESGELDTLLAQQERFFKKRERKNKKHNFFQRFQIPFIITGLVLLVSGFITQDLVKTAKSRPNTLGFSAKEVVESYYAGFTALEHEAMEACLAKGGPKDDINAVMNIYIIAKMRMGYERVILKNDPIPLLDAGIDPRGFVFGTSDLKIEPLKEESEEALFWVEYTLWYPGESKVSAYPSILEPLAQRETRQDLVQLRFLKDRWLISAISREKASLEKSS